MKLLQLEIINFKGIDKGTFNFNGQDATVYGQNKAGKSTILDAQSWLLFDKDSAGQAKFGIKPFDKDNNIIPMLENSVKGVFEHKGQTVELKKVHKEVWTKKRGTLTKEHTANKTDHFIDGLKVAKAKYKAMVADIAADEPTFQMLTNPAHFARLPWKKQRDLVFDVCGTISDAEIIKKNSELHPLTSLVGKHTPEDFKAIVKGQQKDINEQIEAIPSRVDELTRTIEGVTGDEVKAKADLETLRKYVSGKAQEILRLETGGGVAVKQVDLVGVDASLKAIETQQETAKDKLVGQKDIELANHQQGLKELEAEGTRLNADTNTLTLAVEKLEKTNTSLRESWKEVNAEVFHGDTCPTCKQDLPEDMLEAARMSFNQNKATRLTKNVATGKANAATIGEKKKLIATNMENAKVASDKWARTKVIVSDLTKEIYDLAKSIPQLSDLPEYKTQLEAKAKLEKEIADLQSGNTELIDATKKAKEDLEQQVIDAEAIVAGHKSAEAAKTRIEELKKEEKDLATNFETLDGQIYLVDQFTKAKVTEVAALVGVKFKTVRFRLFSAQMNGGLEEVCELTLGGVPYRDLNTAGKVQAGLDVINTLSGYHNFYPPVFVDCRESVTEIPELRAQTVSLIVSPEDETLRIETA